MTESRPPRHLRSVPTGARAAFAGPTAPMGVPTTIRAARTDDADTVADVYLASRRHAGPLIPRGRHTDDEVRTWFATVVLLAHETFVAECKGQVVGVLVLRGESVDQLYVRPEFQRRGIGSRLLAHARQRRRLLRLYTFESNEPARAFYEKQGFRAIAFGNGTTNDEGAPDVLYEWTARPPR